MTTLLFDIAIAMAAWPTKSKSFHSYTKQMKRYTGYFLLNLLSMH